MTAARPFIALFCFGLALTAFWLAGQSLDADGLLMRAVLMQLGGPLAAAGFCLFAALRGARTDRTAWLLFAVGSGLYFLGNLCYVVLALAGIEVPFPALPEAAYFVMALVFAAGMFEYGKVRERVSGVQVYNFILIYCAVALASLFILHQSVAASVMGPFATIVAFLYPALWLSVAASGLLSLMLYRQGRKTFPFALLILAVLAEAVADCIYVLALLDGTYQVGGPTQLLWVASTGLIIWAAMEQIVASRRVAAPVAAGARGSGRGIVQATIPAVAVAIILLSGSLSGALGAGHLAGLAAVLTLAFALVAGLREHWIINTQRQLRGAVEVSRSDLARSQDRLVNVLESTSDSIIVVDREWRVEYFNQRAAQSVQNPVGLVVGANAWDLFPAEMRSVASDRCRDAIATQRPAEFEASFGDLWFEINAYPTADGLSIFFRDISERRRIREEITYLAHHDPLTGLVNRVVFQERLRTALQSGKSVATILLDLDHFKEINDTLGHAVGDILLAAAAKRFAACVGPEDTLARLGGDEFAIIVFGHEDSLEILRLTQELIAAAGAPHVVEGQSIRLAASAGIALSSGPQDADQMFRNADIALDAAKDEARGAFRFFEPAMEAAVHERQALRADLVGALDKGEFELAFQPLVNLRTAGVCGFEALLRWRHPTRGVVPPMQFIPIAEESDLIVGIGDWVLRTAAAEAMRWPIEVSVAVNLSSRQFSAGDLVEKIDAILRETGLDAGRLEIEITETVLLDDSKANLETLRGLRHLGVRIALDDFGTGFSSLGYLQRFPFSKIKIDRSFISGLPESEESKAIVRSVIGLGQSLGMRVTAEGVETQAQFDWIRAGCDEAQGYFLSRPVAASAVPGVIAELAARHPARSRTIPPRLVSG